MTQIKTTLQGIFRSLPFQLGLAHLKHNLLLLSIYAFLIMLVFGQIGKTYGDDFNYGRIADHLRLCSCWMCSSDGHGEESYQVLKANADTMQQLKEDK